MRSMLFLDKVHYTFLPHLFQDSLAAVNMRRTRTGENQNNGRYSLPTRTGANQNNGRYSLPQYQKMIICLFTWIIKMITKCNAAICGVIKESKYLSKQPPN